MVCKPRTRLFTVSAGAERLELPDEEILAVGRILRLQAGDRVACFNGDGKEYFYRIETSHRSALRLALLDFTENPLDAIPETNVFAAATKGSTKDRIVKELTPLGAARIVFFHAERSIGRPPGKQSERLKRIAVESCRQCGRSTIPTVDILELSLAELCERGEFKGTQTILFWEKHESAQPIKLENPQHPVSLVFGPEGGFSTKEIETAQTQGMLVCGLGQRILRSELAAIVGVTLVQAQRNLFYPST